MLSLTMAYIGMSGWLGFIGLVDVDMVEVQEFIMACLTFHQVLTIPGPLSQVQPEIGRGEESKVKYGMSNMVHHQRTS